MYATLFTVLAGVAVAHVEAAVSVLPQLAAHQLAEAQVQIAAGGCVDVLLPLHWQLRRAAIIKPAAGSTCATKQFRYGL